PLFLRPRRPAADRSDLAVARCSSCGSSLTEGWRRGESQLSQPQLCVIGGNSSNKADGAFVVSGRLALDPAFLQQLLLGRRALQKLERAKGFEPSTPTLARSCSTPELHPHPSGPISYPGRGF